MIKIKGLHKISSTISLTWLGQASFYRQHPLNCHIPNTSFFQLLTVIQKAVTQMPPGGWLPWITVITVEWSTKTKTQTWAVMCLMRIVYLHQSRYVAFHQIMQLATKISKLIFTSGSNRRFSLTDFYFIFYHFCFQLYFIIHKTSYFYLDEWWYAR